MAQLPWLRQSAALGPGLPGAVPTDPPVLTVEPGESPGHGGALGPPESRGGVPGRASIQRPEWGLHGLGSAQVAQSRGRAGHRGRSGRGQQVFLGQRHPYLPGSDEGSREAADVSPIAARTQPETAASGVFPPKQKERVPSRPLGIWGWVVLSLISPSAAAQCEIWLWKEKGGEKPIM